MPKERTKASTSKTQTDPLDVTDEIFIKEEEIGEIKKEVVDLDIDTDPTSDDQLEIKKEVEEFPDFLVDPKDIPGIEKIVNIEDILKSKLNSTESTHLLSCENTNNELQKNKTSIPKNSSVLNGSRPSCNCMQHIKHYCITCHVAAIYKADKTECPVCKTVLKLQCSKCKRKYKFLNSTHQYLLQYSRHLNLLTNEKKGIILKCQKKVNFCCSACSFNTENKETFDQHIKIHTEDEKIKQNDYPKVDKQEEFDQNVKTYSEIGKIVKKNDHSKIDNQSNVDDEFIEMYCAKCFKIKKNLSYDIQVKHSCAECQELMFYRCVFCKKLYKSLNIRSHIQSRCLQRIEHFKFHCEHCYFKTEDKHKLELHIKLMHTPVTCEHCKREFVNSGAMKQHKTKGCSIEKSKKKTEMYRSKLKNVETVSTNSTPLQDEDSYEVIEYHPEEIYNEISSRPPKDLDNSNWQTMVDYYCLLCGGQNNKKCSIFRPWCPTCNIKYEYRCKICGKLYGGYTNLRKHVRSECPNRYSLVCSMCNFSSVRKKILLSHIKNKHTVFKCLQCESRYHGYLSLRRHLLSNCNIRSVKNVQKLIALYCKQCCKRIINFEGPTLKSCVKCSSVMSYECLKCNQLFIDLKLAHKHIKNECNPQYYCSKCNYKTYTQYELDIHIKNEHINRKCSDCGVQFRDEEIFKLHRFEELRRKEEKKAFMSKQKAKRRKLS